MANMLYKSFEGAVGFRAQSRLRSLRKTFGAVSGIAPNLAIPKEQMFEMIGDALGYGYMVPDQALAFLSANILQHEDSGFNELDYLPRAIALYNAKDMEDIHFAENAADGSSESKGLWRVYHETHGTRQERIKNVRRYCYLRDIEKGSEGYAIGRWLGRHQTISQGDVNELLGQYNPAHPGGKREELNPDGSVQKTYSAIDLAKYLPILRNQRARGDMTESQCGLFLCFTLHSLERRKLTGDFYVDHPMSVAGLVQKFGKSILKDDKQIWQATIAALLHDIGEKSNFNVTRDLKGLLSDPIADTVIALHKADDQSYFGYIEHIAENPLAAFVKLCDIVHNSSDAGGKPSAKQRFVYPLAAAYLKFKLCNPEQAKGVPIRDFALTEGLCSEEDFERIVNLAKKDSADDGTGIHLNLPTVSSEILEECIISGHHAHARREEIVSLHR